MPRDKIGQICEQCHAGVSVNSMGLCNDCAHAAFGLDPQRDYLEWQQRQDNRKTVAIDFDGVLHVFDRGWQGGEIYGELIDGAWCAIASLSRCYRLVVHTTRLNHVAVWDALDRWGISEYISDVVNVKPIAVAYIDDRAVPFTGDWDATLNALAQVSSK